jgi:site-specific DNA-cytosine methylase
VQELTVAAELIAVDLCCGAGGWACAARGLPIRFALVADLAADCLETWRVNHLRDHPGCLMLRGDLSLAESREQILAALGTRKIDVVLGGIPCEPVSSARGAVRASDGEMDSWHRLLDSCLALVAALRPRWWAIEDVIQIERHLPLPLVCGRATPFRRIEAADFGPQRRLRTFLGKFPDPLPEDGPRCLGDVLDPGPWMSVPAAEACERTNGCVGRDKVRVLDPSKPSWTVMGALDRSSRRRRSWMIETADGRLRKLDWREAALLQGFPRDSIFCAGHMRTQKMIGQAVSIHVGRAILKAIAMDALAQG